MSISRRRFLEGTALSGIAAGVSNAAKTDNTHKLPTRVLVSASPSSGSPNEPQSALPAT